MCRIAPILLIVAPAAFSQAPSRPYLTEPALSPDRSELAFVSGGDIWRVAPNGGEATLLVSHPADDSRPLYSPDGKSLAFVSTRTGGGDIYVLNLVSGDLRRLTFQDGREQLNAWSRDGQWIYFHSSAGDIAAMNDIYRVRASGGTPMPVSADRYLNEFFAAPSPDGKTIAFNARGIAQSQWWRKGHSNLDRSEIWFLRPGPKPSYERVTDGAAREIWPMWAADGKSIFFVSDRTGVENIWRQPVGGTSRQVTQFKDGRVLWPSISHDGKAIFFERDFSIWRADSNNGKAAQVHITLRGAPSTPTLQQLSLTSGFRGLSLSPDGKKVAFIARGEVFAAHAQDGGDAMRITNTTAQEIDPQWSADSKRLVYASDRNGNYQIFSYDFTTQTETQLTSSPYSDAIPRFSPDGKFVSFVRGGKGVWIYDIAAAKESQLASAEVDLPPLVSPKTVAWSPDSAWVAYAASAGKGFTNVYLVPATGGTPRPVSFLANRTTEAVQFSADGKFLLFDTSQRTEDTRVARVDLIPRAPVFREDKFRDLFKSAGQEPAAKPSTATASEKKEPAKTTVDFENIRRRLSLLPIGVDVADLAISPDGKNLLVSASAEGQQNLYAWSLDELATEPPVARQITSTARAKTSIQFAPNSKDVYFIEQGRVFMVSLDSRVVRPLNLKADLDVEFHQEKREVFHQSWSYQRDHFFDDKYNGVDWQSVRKNYEPLIAGSRTTPELHRILNMMMGELNASHMGVSPPPNNDAITGLLGMRFDPAVHESKGQFLITEVIPQSPAALAQVKAGDTLTAVDGTKLAPQSNLAELLDRKVGKRVEIEITSAAGAARKEVLLPVSITTEKQLLYRAWVDERRAYVDKASGGRLGYIHMLDMSSASLNRLYTDLDADNHSREGVVIDVRNNSGGFVNAYALDIFARRPYLTFQERGRAPAPARTALGQRALELPTVLVTNQHSLSDAEDFSEGYRRLKLGKVVGEPTAGWIVYTWAESLIDGSIVRMPRTKVFDNDGQLMEMHPRPVDIPVERPVGESFGGHDGQLDVAVHELLQEVDAAKNRQPGEPRPSAAEQRP